MTTKKRTTLLIVDDTPDNLFALRQVITACLPEPCEIITAASAEEGLSIQAKAALDGVLIDVQMPRIDGIEMCRRLRDDPATANVPVILMTAHGADAALKARGMEVGAMDFISKPIDNIELIARIRVMLRVKRAEDELREINEHLEERVTEATEELRRSQQQYLQAQKMEAIGQLAGGVAHDFRNQLTVIQGYASMLLRRSRGDEKSREYLEVILEAVNRSVTVTNQLLVFSRKERLRPETVDLTESVRTMSKLLPQMVGEDVRLSIVSSPKPCCANVDPGLFQQAVMNLVVNARHAMPDGGALTIETGCVEMDEKAPRGNLDAGEGTYAVVTVSDTGAGMDAETRAKAFDPFFTTKEVGMGTGMGLAMVHGFVAQSGGFIQVDSEPGKGSSFRLCFPLAPCVEAPGVEAPAGPTPVAEPESLPRGTETLLVVEDREEVRHLAVSVLRECGYTVLEAGNAAEALPLGEHYEGEIGLLVADVIMPGMNGVELSERLRRARPDMAVLFVSGYGDSAVSRDILARPGTEVLAKPIDDMTLARAVRRLLDRTQVAS